MKKLYINWQDGMKINAMHFQEMGDAFRFEQTNAMSIGLNRFNYGLLPTPHGDSPFDIFIKLDQSNELVLNLLSCTAITPGGAYISVQPDQQFLSEYRIEREQIKTKMQSSNAEELYVTLNINLYRQQAVGDPLPEEYPIRRPYLVPSMRLELQHFDEVIHHNHNGNFQLVVARLLLKDEVPVKDENYIPPSANIRAHSRLENTVSNWQNSLQNSLLSNVQKTIKNIEERKLLVSTSYPEALNLQSSPAAAANDLSRQLFSTLADILPLMVLRREQAFFYTFSDLQRIANKLWSTIATFNIDKKKNFQNYLQEGLNVEQDITDFLWSFGQTAYHHDRIDEAVKSGQVFLDWLLKLYHSDNGLPRKDFSWKKIKTDTITFTEEKEENRTTTS